MLLSAVYAVACALSDVLLARTPTGRAHAVELLTLRHPRQEVRVSGHPVGDRVPAVRRARRRGGHCRWLVTDDWSEDGSLAREIASFLGRRRHLLVPLNPHRRASPGPHRIQGPDASHVASDFGGPAAAERAAPEPAPGPASGARSDRRRSVSHDSVQPAGEAAREAGCIVGAAPFVHQGL